MPVVPRCRQRPPAAPWPTSGVGRGPSGLPHPAFGLHAGPAVVGNVGARERINYTLVGAVANQASRARGAETRFTAPTSWRGGGGCRTDAGPVSSLAPISIASWRSGTTEVLEIFEPLGEVIRRPRRTPSSSATGRQAARAYIDGRFEEAVARFHAGSGATARPTGRCHLFIARCGGFSHALACRPAGTAPGTSIRSDLSAGGAPLQWRVMIHEEDAPREWRPQRVLCLQEPVEDRAILVARIGVRERSAILAVDDPRRRLARASARRLRASWAGKHPVLRGRARCGSAGRAPGRRRPWSSSSADGNAAAIGREMGEAAAFAQAEHVAETVPPSLMPVSSWCAGSRFPAFRRPLRTMRSMFGRRRTSGLHKRPGPRPLAVGASRMKPRVRAFAQPAPQERRRRCRCRQCIATTSGQSARGGGRNISGT